MNLTPEIERETRVALILSGVIPCVVNQQRCYIKSFRPHVVYESREVYQETYRQAQILGALTDSESQKEIIKAGVWNLYEEQILKELPKKIEDLKIAMYDAYYKFKRRESVEKNLKNKKEQYAHLMFRRNEYKDTTCEGIAELNRKKYLIGLSTYNEEDEPMYNRDTIMQTDDSSLRKLVSAYYQAIPTEEDVRDMVQHEPWRGYWGASKLEGSLFGCPAKDLTELQRVAIMWSRIYDNVYEHTECPPEDLIQNPDMLDGWLLVQGKKQSEARKKQFGEKHVNKAQGADEVFVMVEDVKDIQRVNDMMTPEAKRLKQQRLQQLEKQGIVEEQNMVDSKMKIRTQAMQQMRQQIAAGKKGKR